MADSSSGSAGEAPARFDREALHAWARHLVVGIYEPAVRVYAVCLFGFLMLALGAIVLFSLLAAGYFTARLTPSTVHVSASAVVVGYLLARFRERIRAVIRDSVGSLRQIRSGAAPDTDSSVGTAFLFYGICLLHFVTFAGSRWWAGRILGDRSVVDALRDPTVGTLRVTVAMVVELAGDAMLVGAVAIAVCLPLMAVPLPVDVDWELTRQLAWNAVALRVATVAGVLGLGAGGGAVLARSAGVRTYALPDVVTVTLSLVVLLVAGMVVLLLVAAARWATAAAKSPLVGTRGASGRSRPLQRIGAVGRRMVDGATSLSRQIRRRIRSAVDGAALPAVVSLAGLSGFVVARASVSRAVDGYLSVTGFGGPESFMTVVDPVVLGLDVAGVAALVAAASSGSVALDRLRNRGVDERFRSLREFARGLVRSGVRAGEFLLAPYTGGADVEQGVSFWLRSTALLRLLGVVGVLSNGDGVSLSVDGYPVLDETTPFGLTDSVGRSLFVFAFVASLALAVAHQRGRENPRYGLVAAFLVPVVGPYAYLFFYHHVSGSGSVAGDGA